MLERKWKEALADYQHACEMSPGGQDYPRLYIWVARTRMGDLKTANKELAAYMDKRASNTKTAPDAWVSKLGAFLTGGPKETDLVAAAASDDPKTESARQCEAWFYIGMKKLAGGDKQSATGDFQKCAATGRKDFVEYQVATAELNGELAAGSADLPAQDASPAAPVASALGAAAPEVSQAMPAKTATPSPHPSASPSFKSDAAHPGASLTATPGTTGKNAKPTTATPTPAPKKPTPQPGVQGSGKT
jgi:hypothetical protein